MNCGFVVLWFCGFVDCLCKGEKLSTKQQNHQTTKPHHFLSNSKEDGSFCHLPFFANFMVEPDFCLRE